jgi:hypothetical protein
LRAESNTGHISPILSHADFEYYCSFSHVFFFAHPNAFALNDFPFTSFFFHFSLSVHYINNVYSYHIELRAVHSVQQVFSINRFFLDA